MIEVDAKPSLQNPSRTGLSKFWRPAGYSIAVMSLLVVVASLLGRYALWCELACNFRIYILAMILLLGPVFFALGKRVLVVCWLVATVWCMQGTVSVYLPNGSVAGGIVDGTSTSGVLPPLKIMSFNVLGTNQNYEGVVAEIRKHAPDVLVVLEYANEWGTALERLDDAYPHQLLQPRWHGFGIAVFSKRPFVDPHVQQITREVTDNPFVFVTVEHGGQPIRIAATHLLSPRDHFRLKIRNQQMREIAELLSQAPTNTVLVGDFNCVPWSGYISDLLSVTGYRDSRHGFGYHGSWHAKKWFVSIPIDHGFVSPNICVHDRRLGHAANSDHLPLILEVSVTATQSAAK